MKKKLNIILLLFVIFIWLKILLNFFLPSKSLIEKPITISSKKTPIITKRKQIVLNPIRDPFKSVSYKKTPQNSKNKKPIPKSKPVVKNKKEVKCPSMEYLGYIKSKHAKYPTILIKIDHKLYRVKLYQEIKKNIKLKKFYLDSIVVFCFNQKIALKKKHIK